MFTYFLTLSSGLILASAFQVCRIFRRRRVRSTDYSSFDPANLCCFGIVSFTHAMARLIRCSASAAADAFG